MEIQVYIDDGRVFKYNVSNESKAREHSSAIVATGYRHNPENPEGEDYFEHYPPHRIMKVKVVGKLDTAYHDTVSGT